jgi:GDSL-like Lipase/Acylhydrolase family
MKASRWAVAVIGAVLAAMLPASAALAFPGGVRGGGAVGRQSVKPSSMHLRTVTVTPIPRGDEVVTGSGDGDGWHLYAAAAGDGWRWHPLATLAPAGVDANGERWIGRQCLTGDGRYVVAVVAPWSANNDPAGMDRGGLAYAVDAHTGAVRPLAGGVSLHYFTPSCGTGSAATLTRYPGRDEQSTQLVRADAASGRVEVTPALPGEVTGAVPAGASGFLAARGNTIERIASSGRETMLARVQGQPFDLTANAAGGADFLLGRDGDSATVWQSTANGARQVGTGSFADLALFNGRGGHTIAAGTTRVDPAAGIRALGAQWGPVEAVSLNAAAVSVSAATAARPSAGAAGVDLPRTPLQVRLAETGVPRPRSAAIPGPGRPSAPWVPDVAAPATTALPAAPSVPGAHAPGINGFISSCAVPRNHVDLQAMQPSPAMVDWAANLAGQRALSGQAARPAGFANLGLPAYAPGQDFPMDTLSGSGGTSIPREVFEGIFAQESNLKQATWHSIEGVAGNPLIADYYGAGGGDQVGMVTPDCGYGIGQVTTGMTSGAMNYDLQRKVAVDYAENIAASAQILAAKWNELIAAGITANDSNPSILENWYLAIWDYNSGLHPNTGGPWGLGWANNPANPAYPYNRHPFLHQQLTAFPLTWQVTYDDAKTPGNWPYQERVFGWMEVPLINATTGLYSYSGTLEWSHDGINDQQLNPFELARPDLLAFCDTAKNQCDPATAAGSNPCTLSSLQCWWHSPATWCNPVTNICHSGSWTVSPGAAEPQPSNDYYPSICNINTLDVPGGSTIVDSQPAGINLQGCNPGADNWHSTGSFAFAFGDPNHPAAQQTDMDLHQLGTGLGGHIWFTHTDEPTDPTGASYWGLTGTWTPSLAKGRYQIKAFIPAGGATATQANYTIANGAGLTWTTTLNQNSYTNQWISLGDYWLGPGATVSLTNLGVLTSGDLAFSGMAFIPQTPGTYTMLGDSYSAGEGAGTYDTNTNNYTTTCSGSPCTNNGHRSPYSYNRSFALTSQTFRNPSTWVDVACSGAVIADYSTTNASGKCPNEPGQKTALNATTSLVTLTFGGNDLDFAPVIKACVYAGVNPLAPTCQATWAATFQTQIQQLAAPNTAGGLPLLYSEIKAAAPNAEIVVLGYPHLVRPGSDANGGCLANGWIRASDRDWLNSVADQLDTVIQNAATQADLPYLSTTAMYTGHELCSTNPWFTGIGDPTPNDTPTGLWNFLQSASGTNIQQYFHPNTGGYSAEAGLLDQKLQIR